MGFRRRRARAGAMGAGSIEQKVLHAVDMVWGCFGERPVIGKVTLDFLIPIVVPTALLRLRVGGLSGRLSGGEAGRSLARDSEVHRELVEGEGSRERGAGCMEDSFWRRNAATSFLYRLRRKSSC